MTQHDQYREPVIVILDDDEAMQTVLKTALSMRGFRVLIYQDKAAFLGHWALIQPGLIITDLKSPGMDGLEFLKKAKSTDQFKNVPVVFLSGSDSILEKSTALTMGAAKWYDKPVDIDELVEGMHEVLLVASLKP